MLQSNYDGKIIMKISSLLLVLLLSSIFLVVVNSCTSPTDVHANRIEKRNSDIKSENIAKELSIRETEIRFLDVPYQSSKAGFFTITNTSAKTIIINSIGVSVNKDCFQITGIDLPFILKPKDMDSSSREILLIFTGLKVGEFTDTLRINGQSEPNLKLYASVPLVQVSDVDFQFQKIGQTKTKPPIYVQNNTDRKVVIRDYKLIDPDGVFEFLSNLPIELPAWSKQALIVRFNPKSDKTYNGRIEFKIDGVIGYIDNTCDLIGFGIQ